MIKIDPFTKQQEMHYADHDCSRSKTKNKANLVSSSFCIGRTSYAGRPCWISLDLRKNAVICLEHWFFSFFALLTLKFGYIGNSFTFFLNVQSGIVVRALAKPYQCGWVRVRIHRGMVGVHWGRIHLGASSTTSEITALSFR